MLKEERCMAIIHKLKESNGPISATALAKEYQVSRQVIVQDIALLRAKSYAIISTARGYLLQENNRLQRVIKVNHQDHEIEEELQVIVDLGGQVLDVYIDHETYGRLVAELPIKSRRDISVFMKGLEEGKSSPLKNLTFGHHYHTIVADDEETLDLIVEELQKKGFISS